MENIRADMIEMLRDAREYLLVLRETGVDEIGLERTKPEAGGQMSKEKDGSVVDIKNLVSGEQKAHSLDSLQKKIGDCRLCKLWKGRTNLVFGTGNPDAKLLFVGEAPGREEDLQGQPFVGKAGRLLTRMLEAMGLVRDNVYIANVVKCRPPGNRNPEGDEISACRSFLNEQIDIIRPPVICTLGSFATHTLLETKEAISRLRGSVHEQGGYRIVPTFHPAYLLRNPQDKRLAWEDMKIIMKELGLERSEK